MKRDDYLADKDVAGFVLWAGHLVRGEWGLRHSYAGKRGSGSRFQCSTLYEAYGQYRWPDDRRWESADQTMDRFDGYRRRFNEIGAISTPADRQAFYDIAHEIARWGGINRLRVDSYGNWGGMTPAKFRGHIDEIKRKLDPAKADTDDLPGSLRMGSGFSKIYAALILGLPIYDSRVGCAHTCLVRLYCRDAALSITPTFLNLGMPEPYGNKEGRCKQTISREQSQEYAKANLQFAWLMQALVADPGDFENVLESRRVDALQSALFMLGYTSLLDNAVVKTR